MSKLCNNAHPDQDHRSSQSVSRFLFVYQWLIQIPEAGWYGVVCRPETVSFFDNFAKPPNRQTAEPPNRQINHTFILCGMRIACELGKYHKNTRTCR